MGHESLSVDYLKRHPLRMRSAPSSYNGAFSEFYREYIEPGLPSPERVRKFHDLLAEYVRSPEAVFHVRKTTSLERGHLYTTADGSGFIPTDNAPGWYFHALVLSNARLPDSGFELFGDVPCSMFALRGAKTLNSANFHLAHIVDVKNGNVDWINWSRAELERRMILSIHPCNWFLLSKSDWQRWGTDSAVIAWIKDAYRLRYGSLFTSFLDSPRAESGQDRPLVRDPVYRYESASKRTAVGKTEASGVGVTIRRDWLDRDRTLAIVHGGARYLVPHDALVSWVAANKTALVTPSWKEKGLYHWTRLPADMVAFLEATAAKSLVAG